MKYNLSNEHERINANLRFNYLMKGKRNIILREIKVAPQGKKEIASLLHVYFEYLSKTLCVPFEFVKIKLFKLGACNKTFKTTCNVPEYNKKYTECYKKYTWCKSIKDIEKTELEKCFLKFRSYVIEHFQIYLPYINETENIKQIIQFIKENEHENEKDSRA